MAGRVVVIEHVRCGGVVAIVAAAGSTTTYKRGGKIKASTLQE
jgi:hypothetical protein